ncbi:hypothetical protein NTD89_04120 [Pseudomonas sp. 14P_5.3_Bac1]|jgi:hypothetical protein|uniref:hypothetical protein n=1 Tax=unclassified Pseudomonas TaxID=196821 RepID=UPI000F560F6B|nr:MULTISPECIES: hypothetical protein [unclassified Pseudomonas]AZF63745.1 hypothetical protein C4J83_2756 [Pseudomonas sp. LBUM920]MCU1776194.1 hypothetical protein [Pseudomonas sp. 14P_5.3_Bac1]
MISNLKSDIEFRHEKALELSSQVRQHLAAGGKFTIGKSPAINPAPAKRSEFVDPTTILKRRKPLITRAEREALRKLAEAL